jgi:hypothetical protein
MLSNANFSVVKKVQFSRLNSSLRSGLYFINFSGVVAPPTVVWHYAIIEHTILFRIPELNLLKVNIKKLANNLRTGKQYIPASVENSA